MKTDFVPISPNPYIVGNPVRGRSMFFGREHEFRLVQQRFRESKQGVIIVFCGERRSGKTSILFQILDGRLGSEFLPVLVDMQAMVISDEAEFFERITAEIVVTLDPESSLDLPVYRTTEKPSRRFMKFMDLLVAKHPDKRPVLLIDEYELIESKIEAGVMSEDVLLALAALLNKHPLFLVFTGSQHLEDRRAPYWRILGQSIHRRISFLDRSDAIDLITKPVSDRLHYAEGTIDRLIRLGAGQPFYTQALCQAVVDHANEHRSDVVSMAVLDAVIAGIISNPFPQMVFLWESLSPDEKLTLGLLAEFLPDENAHAVSSDLMRVVQDRYPLEELNQERVEAALEELFAKELLQKHTDVKKGYAYRIDLWRLWIEREHSVWQVMRELGIIVAPQLPLWRRLARRPLPIVGLLVILLGAAELIRRSQIDPLTLSEEVEATLRTESLVISPEPSDASVYLDADSLGSGRWHGRVPVDSALTFRLAADGFADTTIAVTLRAGQDRVVDVALRQLTGSMRVSSNPQGAEITVDGQARGRSPQVVSGLAVNVLHEVSVTLDGFEPQSTTASVAAADTLDEVFDLTRAMHQVVFVTQPSQADVFVGGQLTDPPVRLAEGEHLISVRHEGYVTLDTLITVSNTTRVVELSLEEAPPGALVLFGDDLARYIYIDGEQIAAGTHNSQPQLRPPGEYEIRVVRYGADDVVKMISIPPGDTVWYEYSRDELSTQEP